MEDAAEVRAGRESAAETFVIPILQSIWLRRAIIV